MKKRLIYRRTFTDVYKNQVFFSPRIVSSFYRTGLMTAILKYFSIFIIRKVLQFHFGTVIDFIFQVKLNSLMLIGCTVFTKILVLFICLFSLYPAIFHG